jgi:hypothetical protein
MARRPRQLGSRSIATVIVLLLLAAGLRVVTDHEPGGDVSGAVPERRFIRIGASTRSFSDEQIEELVARYDYVMFTKFHVDFDIQAQHADARRLVAADPDVKVLPYFSTRYWFEQNQWGVDIDPDWLLRDEEGNLVPKVRAGEEDEGASYVDLANPDYRDWALDVMASWLEAAPYAGISFDAAGPIGDHDPRDIERWQELLGKRRVDEYNAGLRDLISRANALVGPTREVVYNGIAPSRYRGPGRDLDLLSVSDGALDERFCVDGKGVPAGIQADLDLMAITTDKRLFLRTSVPASVSDDDRDRIVRLCNAAFLLGWVPGRSYFQLGSSYTTAQLPGEPELDVDLGDPAGPAEGDEVRTRRFEHGMVVVNLSDRPTIVRMPVALDTVDGGRRTGAHGRGEEISVPALDAVLLIEPA